MGRRAHLLVLGLGLVAGCVPAVRMGMGTDDRVPELALALEQGVGGIRAAAVVGVCARSGRDVLIFEAPVGGVPTTVAEIATDVELRTVRLGGEILFPAGRSTISFGATFSVVQTDAPTLSAGDVAALAAAQVTGVSTASDGRDLCFNVRVGWRVPLGRMGALGLYAEVCDDGVPGSTSYTYTPTGAVTEHETWNLKKARYGATYTMMF